MDYHKELRHYHTKFYKLALYQGLIRLLGISGGLFLVLTGAEMLFWMTPLMKSVLVLACGAWLLYLMHRFLWIPVQVLYLGGRGRSLKESAREVGAFYPAISDRLLNLLELEEQLLQMQDPHPLHQLAILQKARLVSQYPLTQALDFSRLRNDLKYSLPPLLLLLLTYFLLPGPFLAGAHRLTAPGTEFHKPAPFAVHLEHPVVHRRGQPVQARFQIEGKWVPQEIHIQDPGNELWIPAANLGSGRFMAQWEPTQKKVFMIHAAGYSFGPYTIMYEPRPEISGLRIVIEPPAYTRLKQDTFTGMGDFTAALGSKVTLHMQYTEVEELGAGMQDAAWDPAQLKHASGQHKSPATTSIQGRVMASGNWLIWGKAPGKNSWDTLGGGRIAVIDDAYPTVQAQAIMDSTGFRKFWFPALFNDDYGFTRARLYFRNRGTELWDSLSMGTPPGKELVWESFAELDLTASEGHNQVKPGPLEWFIRVWDNDGIRGPKSTSTQVDVVYIPENQEVRAELAKMDQKMGKELEALLAEARNIRKETEALQKKLQEQGRLDPREQNRMQDLQKRQESLMERLADFQDKMTQKNLSEEKMESHSSRILEKQRRIEELAKEALDKETLAMMEELQKLLLEMNRDGLKQELEKKSMDAQALEKELDRMLALLEQLKLEKAIDDLAQRFDELKQKQDQTREELKQSMDKQGRLDQEQQNKMSQKQEQIRKETQKAMEELNALKEKNPGSVDEQSQKQKELKQSLDQSQEQLEKGKPQGAEESMKDAAEAMEEMAQALKNQLGQMDMKSISLNLKATRELLENLIRLSFDQERLMEGLSQLRGIDPQYLNLVRNQFDLLRSMQTVSDSLEALGKRVPQMSHELLRKSTMARNQMEQSIKAMEQQAQAEALSRQQFALTSINDLAVLLSELMDMMQAQMKSAMKMQGSKPGSQKQGEGPKPDEGKLSQMQEQLNKSMKEALDGIKSGKLGGRQLSQEMARMAEQQEAIRQALEEEMKNEKAGGGLGQTREEMEKTEKELFNKQLSQQTMKRQEEILTRLLESEKAEREKEWEERRQSRRGTDQNQLQQKALQDYLKKIEQDASGLRIKNSELNAYYNEIFNNYLRSINLGEK